MKNLLPIFAGCIIVLSSCIQPTNSINTQTETDSKTDIVVATNLQPVSLHTSELIDDTIYFDASQSYDPDGQIVEYRWLVNDEVVSREKIGSYKPDHSGLFTLSLIVEDNKGLIGASSEIQYELDFIPTENTAPYAKAYISIEDFTVSFNALDVSDDYDTPDQLNYLWTINGVTMLEGINPVTEVEAGYHYFDLTVTDRNGLFIKTQSQNFSIGMPNLAPTAKLEVVAQHDWYAVFKASEAMDLNGEEITFEWSFGDDTSAFGEQVNHEYEADGSYTVMLSVTDGELVSHYPMQINVEKEVYVPVANNLISNGDFESGIAPWGKFGEIEYSFSDIAHSGNTSLYVYDRAAAWSSINYEFGPLTLGNDYEFNVWMRLDAGESTTGKLSLFYVDSVGAHIENVATAELVAGKWTLLKGTYTHLPQGELTDMFVYAEATRTSANYFVDDLSITGDVDPILPMPSNIDIAIDHHTAYQVIDGFGALGPMWGIEPWSESQTEKLYGMGEDQLGLSIIRTMLTPDPNTWKDYVNLLKNVQNTGEDVKIMATPWSPPAYMKDNNSLIYGGKLLPEYYDDYAYHLNNYVYYMQDNDIEIDVISIQNEPDWIPGYESCEWDGITIRNFMRDHGDKIKNAKVLIGESVGFNRDITDPALVDAGALENIDLVGGHLYGAQSSGNFEEYPLAEITGTRVWMTEWYTHEADGNGSDIWGDDFHKTTWDETLDDVLGGIHHSMEINWSAYIWWWAVRFYSFMGDGDPIYGTQEGQILKRGWAFSHYSKFVRPDSLRVQANTMALAQNLDVTVYQKDKQLILVILNRETNPVDGVKIGFTQNIESAEFYYTSQFRNRELMPSTVDGQTVTVDIGARSISTIILNL
ncbi:PKD domain-containing protein [Marinicellulosiphila megalodicopiae]|uniref:PKD domain-containing protein n=1 Tax=Marinicellulosiphila megalodicopiae TaxID=2724896 RepID=UPI003BAE4263